jgi:hypothetical protein
LDGNPGTLSCRFKKTDPRYDDVIANAMTLSRFLHLKRYVKLNNNSVEKPRTAPDFDPCNKYDMIFKVMCHNMNYCTLRADLDLAVDESTWGFAGYCGEAGWRLMNKPVGKGKCNTVLLGVPLTPASLTCPYLTTTGGQTTMLYDVSRRYPRHYIHRHKLTDKRRPPGFNQEGPAEIVQMVDAIDNLIKGKLDTDHDDMFTLLPHPSGKIIWYKKTAIFTRPPHLIADNYFSGEHVMDFIGKKGYGITCTCRRDRIPKAIKPYIHHEKVTNYDQKAKVMRFQNPITAIKQVPANGDEKAYTKTFVSFQSTGPTNIAGVNNLPSCRLYVSKKERGRKDDKLVWGIEQNEGRETYLGHYFGIDIADHMIQNANIRYISWRYWHMPFLHALSMGVIAAYDMYNECCDGGLDNEWEIPEHKRMSFSVFRQTLGKQMLEYDPAKLKYLGDEKSRSATQGHKKRKKVTGGTRQQRKREEESYYNEGGMTLGNFIKAMEMPRLAHDGNLTMLQEHFVNITKKSNKMTCDVCGEATYWRCDICCKPVCVTDGARKWNGATCAIAFHNPSFWGLAMSDVHLHKMTTREWTPPTRQMIKRNEDRVEALKTELYKFSSL